MNEQRRKKGINLEQLSEGLCSFSELALIENGKRSVGKALRDRLLHRLGISPDDYDHFVFEEEYGTKIDAILDAVTLELDKNLEKSEKIRTLDRRMDRAEAHIFNHEKKFARLEPKK